MALSLRPLRLKFRDRRFEPNPSQLQQIPVATNALTWHMHSAGLRVALTPMELAKLLCNRFRALPGTMRRKPSVTMTPAKKIWTRPELMRLGSIPDVAGSIGDTTQGGKLVRS